MRKIIHEQNVERSEELLLTGLSGSANHHGEDPVSLDHLFHTASLTEKFIV